MESLRSLLRQGYRILPPAVEPVDRSRGGHLAAPASSELANGEPQTDSGRAESHTQMSALEDWEAAELRSWIASRRVLPPERRWRDVEQARLLIERMLEFSEPLLAFDSASEALQFHPADTRLRQLQGLSLARAGAALKANQVFRQLLEDGYTDEETLGNLARTYKSLWENCQEPDQKSAYLVLAYDAYLHSFKQTSGYWSGINVAFLALMRGDQRTARATAQHVRQMCLASITLPARSESELYWLTATVAETFLIEGRTEEATAWYRRATSIAGKKHGNIASTCRQAQQTSEALAYRLVQAE